MSFIDIILGGAIAAGFIRGLMKGLFVEVASLVGLVAGIYGAIHFSYYASDFLVERVSWDEKYINLVAFIITFIIIIIIVTLAGKLLTKIADFAALGILNKILGGAFGGLKAAIILGAFLVFFNKANNTMTFINKETVEASILFQPVHDIGAFVFSKVLKNGDETTTPEQNDVQGE